VRISVCIYMHDLIDIDDNKRTIADKLARECSDQAVYMTLNKNLIKPLLDWRFITAYRHEPSVSYISCSDVV
jgi:hypothetical protein